jgi:hypothetical protein
MRISAKFRKTLFLLSFPILSVLTSHPALPLPVIPTPAPSGHSGPDPESQQKKSTPTRTNRFPESTSISDKAVRQATKGRKSHALAQVSPLLGAGEV